MSKKIRFTISILIIIMFASIYTEINVCNPKLFVNSVAYANGKITVTDPSTVNVTSIYIKQKILNSYENLNIYWGDIHGHTGFSDGYGLPDEYFYKARHLHNLDFAAVTDHAVHMNRYQKLLVVEPGEKTLWELTIETVNENYDIGSFVTILGFEWTNDKYGHRNVYFRDTINVPEKPLDYITYPTPEYLWNALEEYEAITIPHHTMRYGTFIDTTYRNNDIERLIEIHSKWGSSERPLANYEPMQIYLRFPQLVGEARGKSVLDLLNLGFIVGIIGGTDTHQGLAGSTIRDERRGIIYDPQLDPIPRTVGEFVQLLEQGYTLDHREPPIGGNGAIMAVFSEALNREGIWDSMYDRRTYASTGPRASVYFTVMDTKNSSNTAIMGEEIYLEGNPHILVYVLGEFASTIEKIFIIKNGRKLVEVQNDQIDILFEFEEKNYDRTSAYYALKVFVKQDESGNHDNDYVYDVKGNVFGPQLDEILWSSPIWVYPAVY